MNAFEETAGTNAFTERFGAAKIRLRSFSDAVRFDVDCSESVCLLHVNGAIDIYNSAELEAKIADLGREQPGAILVSFALCSFVDCSCLRILIRQFKELGARLLIIAPSTTALYRILDLTHLAKALPVHESPREAFLAVAPDVSRIDQHYTKSG